MISSVPGFNKGLCRVGIFASFNSFRCKAYNPAGSGTKTEASLYTAGFGNWPILVVLGSLNSRAESEKSRLHACLANTSADR